MINRLSILLPWQRVLVALAALACAIVAVFLSYLNFQSDNSHAKASQKFSFEWVDTEDSREKGLSGRDSLSPYQAMVFKNDDNGTMCMWMKDMKFKLAILWLDAEQNITYIESNLDPSTYPKTFCHKASYVIEMLPQDLIASGLVVGQKLQLDR